MGGTLKIFKYLLLSLVLSGCATATNKAEVFAHQSLELFFGQLQANLAARKDGTLAVEEIVFSDNYNIAMVKAKVSIDEKGNKLEAYAFFLLAKQPLVGWAIVGFTQRKIAPNEGVDDKKL